MSYTSINPFTQFELKSYKTDSYEELLPKIGQIDEAQIAWKTTTFSQRSSLLNKAAEILEAHIEDYATLLTTEMGKIRSESKAEILKCVACLRYYAENGASLLANEPVSNSASTAMIAYEPLGVILAIMPWNFPFWQAIRFLAPTLMAGNGALLKHASNVPQAAEALEQLFLNAGFPEGLFQNLFIDSSQIPLLIAHHAIKAVTITGSEEAGRSVAEAAGKNLKKLVLELGGSDPFIVTESVNCEAIAKKAVAARMINNGQSCVAAKRFIIQESIFDRFCEAMKHEMESLHYGDPMLNTTSYGPLAKPEFVKAIHEQVTQSLEMGAILITGGDKIGKKHEAYLPTLIHVTNYSQKVWVEETFGPVAAIVPYKNDSEATQLANNSDYGLGASVWCQDTDRALHIASQIQSGSVFINEIMKSDPTMPFGGIKNSGYGRELSSFGIREFMNIKTILVK